MNRLAALLLVAALAAAQGGGPKRKPVMDWQAKEKTNRFGTAVRAGDAVLYVIDGKLLVCRAIDDGEKRWERTVSQRARPVVHGGSVWVGLDAFSLESGDPAPVQGVEGHFDAPPAFSKDYGAAVSVEGKLFLLDLHSGLKVRAVDVGATRVGVSLAGARAYVMNDAGHLMAIAAKPGREVWRVELGEPARSAPVRLKQHLFVALRDVIVVVHTKDGSVVARIASKGMATPLGASRRVLFYGTRDGVVVRLDAETRRELSRISVADETVTGELTAGGGLLYGVAGKRLFAIHNRTGARVWTVDGPSPYSSPLASGGGLFLAAGNVFYCLR